MANAKLDQNSRPTLTALSSADDGTIVAVWADPTTHRLLVDLAGGSGTVTSVSVVSANGFAGTVATATTTPAITLSTTINSPVLAGNGTAISAATTTGTGSTVVLQGTPTLTTPVIGAATGTSLTVTGLLASGTGLTLEETGAGSDTITLQAPAAITASYVLTLPVDDGASGEVLSTDGSGVLSWVSAGGVPTTITVANEATDTSCFLAFFTAASGDLGPKTNANLTLNSNTGVVTFGQTVVASITGNAGTVTVADEASDTTCFLGFYTADSGSLAGKTNTNLTFNSSTGVATFGQTIAGSITGTAGVGTTVTIADEATDTSCFLTFVTAATGNLGVKSNANLTFNSNTGVATFGQTIVGSISGTAGVGTLVTVADETADATCFITFVTAATGNLGVKSNTNMTFASDTGIATFASTVLTTTDINGGTIDGVTIGGASAGAITGTTITANTGFMPDANDGAYLGQAGTAFSDLFLAEGGVINWDSSDATITQTGNVLAVAGADFRIATADVGTNADSVPTLSSTNTLTNKTLTSPVLTTPSAFTTGGTITLAENTSIALDPAGSADGKYTGITIAGTAGAALAFGDLIYLAAADSRWELTDADAAATANVLIGMCVLAAAADGDPTTILLQGAIRADTAFPAMTISARMYMGETAGDIQATIPTGADAIIRAVGYALTADELYFCPSMDSQATVA